MVTVKELQNLVGVLIGLLQARDNIRCFVVFWDLFGSFLLTVADRSLQQRDQSMENYHR